MAARETRNLHFVFLPYFTSSHLIPLVDAARVLASHGVKASIITTPNNAGIFQSSVDLTINSGHQITVHSLKFPSQQVNLPQGIENFSTASSVEQSNKIWQAIELLQKPMENLIRSLSPDCIFSDMFFPWTVDLAAELQIPRLMFFPSNFLYQCVKRNIKLYTPHNNVELESQSFSIPELPDKIEMIKSQLPKFYKTKTYYGEYLKVIDESQMRSYGTVHDTFSELEPAYVDYYTKVINRKSWHIGPLFHFSGRSEIRMSRASINSGENCLNWLDKQKPKSVLYVCFGSMVKLGDAQLTEIATALKATNYPFIWAMKQKWFEIEEKNGVIIKGWAPQIKILNHPAIGGFMSHCGWNSVLESMVAGVPLITFPMFAEQFFNEKLIQILGNGVGVGSEVWNETMEIKGVVVGKEKIAEAVGKLMGEGEIMRRRAEEIAAMARSATEEGGSSYNDIMALIEDVKSFAVQKKYC